MSQRHTVAATRQGWRAEISRPQWLVLAGTTLGWALDGFAGSLYALIIGPTMTELLPHSGITADKASIGFYGGITIAIYLIGWATGGILFGMLADYFGRVRVLSIGIITYAVFTAAAAFADTWWQLGLLRFIAGVGSGVEGPVGAALVAEAWRNRFRARAGGIMMSGYAAGFFLAALLYSVLGGFGWRVMFAVALTPALLVWFIRRYIHEPEELDDIKNARRARKARGTRTSEDRFVLTKLLTPPTLRHTVVATLIATGSLVAFWSVSTWMPQIVRELAVAEGLGTGAVAHRVSIASMLFNVGGILGYASWGFLADWVGRKPAFVVSFVTAGVSIGFLFPFDHSYPVYLAVLPIVGFGLFGALSGNFVYFPELFRPSMRATGMALTNSVGRYVTAAGPFTAGVISTAWFGGNLGMAATVLSCVGVIGVLGVVLAPETRGRELPAERPDPAPGESRPAGAPEAVQST